MKTSDANYYGKAWAPHYDQIFNYVDEPTIDLLEDLAGSGRRALELAIGTGRIALPLAARGVEVTGVDISPEMIEKLREKPGGEAIRVIEGDFADVHLPDQFPLVILAFNTLFSLIDQERQVECFANAAELLEPGGRFVLECFVPDVKRFDSQHTRMGVSSLGENGAHAYEMSIHHPTSQRVESQMVRRSADGSVLVLPVEIRYVWPSEMDLMARIAGLELEDRFEWYDRQPFTEASEQHVSVYRKA